MGIIIFHKLNKILSYNKLINIICGPRGVGKTFPCKDFCIGKAIKSIITDADGNRKCPHNKFIYLRRYKTEINGKKMQSFFNDINYKYEEKLFCNGKTFFYDDVEIGTVLPLSTYVSNKSVIWSEYNNIIFDEFIIDKGSYHYLPNEVDIFLEFYFTVARMDHNGKMNEVKCFLLGNALSSINPYFIYWQINPNFTATETYFVKSPKTTEVIAEIIINDEYAAAVSETKAGALIAGSEYENYAFNNKFLRDNTNFVETKTPCCMYLATIIYGGKKMGMWIDWNTGLYYISEKFDNDYKMKLTFSTDDHSPNYILIDAVKKQDWFKRFIWAFQIGFVRFDSLQIKNICYNLIKMF